jgi:hypothetical protein
MFSDPLSSSSLSDRASSPVCDLVATQLPLDAAPAPIPRSRPSALVESNRTAETSGNLPDGDQMDIDKAWPLLQRPLSVAADSSVDHWRSSLPSSSAHSAQSPLPSQPTQARPNNLDSRETRQTGQEGVLEKRPINADTSLTSEDRITIQRETGPILSALHKGDSELYQLSFDELRQMVAEVIREPGFTELVSSHTYFPGKSLMFIPA